MKHLVELVYPKYNLCYMAYSLADGGLELRYTRPDLA